MILQLYKVTLMGSHYAADGFRFWPVHDGYRWAFEWPDDGLGSAHGKGATLEIAVRQASAWRARGR